MTHDAHEALKVAIGHIEHMAAWITATKINTYSFESLGEDMPWLREALTTSAPKGKPGYAAGFEACRKAAKDIANYHAVGNGDQYDDADIGGCTTATAIHDAIAALPQPITPKRHSIEFDGFTGTVIGYYTTLEGKEGVVLQQDGTRVVHVYGRKHLKPAVAEDGYYAIQSALSPHIASSTELMAAMSSIWPLIKPHSNESAEALELAYGLLWIVGCDRQTTSGNALYLARKALYERIDKDGQARGITAARKALADNPFHNLPDPVDTGVFPRTDGRPGDTGTGDGASGAVAAVRDDGDSAGAASATGLDRLDAGSGVRKALPDWGQLVQILLRCMDATIKNETSRDQAERMANELLEKYPALSKPSDAVNESAEARLREALEPFVKHYEPWMERLSDDDQMCVFPRHSMGDLRRARKALSACGGEAKKSEGGTFTNCASCDMPRTCLDHGRCFGPSDPPDRREIVARLNTLARYAFNEGFAQGMREETSRRGGKTWDEFGPKYEKAILAALDGGAGA